MNIPTIDLSSITADDLSKIKEFGQIAWRLMPSRLKKAAHGLAEVNWNNIRWSSKAEIYLQHLYAKVATTRLLGNAKQIRISDIFTDVYIYDKPLATSREQFDALDAGSLKAKRLKDERNRRPAKSILDKDRIYLLGKPGAGKTTLLRYLVLQSIILGGRPTPIYLQLKDVTENVSSLEQVQFWQAIVDQFLISKLPNTELFVQELVASGQATLFLDGLDEVTQRAGIRSALVSQILAFSSKYPKCKIVLTCRVGASDFTFERFAVAQIADFSPPQQVAFVKRWYSSDKSTLDSFLGQWKAPQNAGLRDLASTPLLLALLCISFDETREFPLRRGDLYREATEALLRRWSISRGIERDNPFQNLTASRKEQMLSFMAFELLKRGRVIFDQHDASALIDVFLKTLPRKESLGIYDPVDVIGHIEAAHGLLVHETTDFLAFSHLTIHEYFAARFLIDSSNERILQRELSFATISNPQWREVILLAAGLVASADYLLQLIRRALCQVLANEPTLRRIFEALRNPENYDANRIWGATVVGARFDARRPELVSGISLSVFEDTLRTRLDSLVSP